MAINDEVLLDAPIHYWRLNEAAGATQVLDTGSESVKDHLAVTGVTLGETSYCPGLATCALFAGNDHLEGGGGSEWDISGANAEFTWEWWMYLTDDSTTMVIWGLETVGQDANSRPYVLFSGGDIYLDRNNVADNVGSGIGTMTTGEWYHCVITYDNGASPEVRTYVNGAATGTGTLAGNFTFNATVSNWIGESAVGTGDFHGYIDEFAVYNKVLSAARVAAHYNNACLAGNDGWAWEEAEGWKVVA